MSDHPLELLAEPLRRRALALNPQVCDPHRDFVLYWMRTALRGHENPALDAAIALADALELPLLVHQQLSADGPRASDRHHRFILEGARDAHAELADRGITSVFHLQRPGQPTSPVGSLAASAAAVVTECFPRQPFPEQARSLARSLSCGMIEVDAACLVPMTTVPAGAADRAFRFRRATAAERQEALTRRPVETGPRIRGGLPDLPFEPVALANADFAELVAACAIDHRTAPVAHTPGGSIAGYARWEAFRDRGLDQYHQRRNDPLMNGVSRLSPWLHHGMVAPFRIAREAHEHGGPGAEKFLDELLIWREMAFAWCLQVPEHERIRALPDWARETLAAHAADPRPVLHDLESLARGRTGDALWDAAQASLRIHGELHNNVRMTWGKMIVQWSPDPVSALARLIELNDRYALDGGDPNSIAGLLWCLGGFDRPFDPPRPVLGRVRPRATATHARRLDPVVWGARTRAPVRDDPPRVAVVGAGMAGLICARTLADHGWPVTLFDKGRRPGGRLATRTRRSDPEVAFDHGVPAFRATDPRFLACLEHWIEADRVRRWPDPDQDCFTAVGGGAALAAHLAAPLTENLELYPDRRIEGLSRSPEGWMLQAADGTGAGPFDALVLNLPPAQAADLLGTCSDEDDPLLRRLGAIPMTRCWTALVRAPGADPGRAIQSPLAAPLATLIAEEYRPGGGRTGCFSVHADADFSAGQVDAAPEVVAELLAPAIAATLDVPQSSLEIRCHRWRQAFPPEGAPAAELRDPQRNLILCGDWAHPGAADSGLERAFLSGAAAAGRLLGSDIQGPRRSSSPLRQENLLDP